MKAGVRVQGSGVSQSPNDTEIEFSPLIADLRTLTPGP